MNKIFFNEITEAWAIGMNQEELAKELGIPVQDVVDIYNYQDKELEAYFEQQKQNEPTPPEDEDYYEITRTWSKP